MKYEYGEPLTQSAKFPDDINRSDGSVFAHFSQKAKLHRVITCINACAGVSNEELEKIGLGGVAKIMAESKNNAIIAAIHVVGPSAANSARTNNALAGPPLIPEQAAEWEWTGEQPRKLMRGEAGLCVPRHDNERPWIMDSCPASESASLYWPLRFRQTPKAEEPTIPQNATLNDIADLLDSILKVLFDRLPKERAE